jgi:hypothetical protein
MEMTIHTLAKLMEETGTLLKYNTDEDNWYCKDINDLNGNKWDKVYVSIEKLFHRAIAKKLEQKLNRQEREWLQSGTDLLPAPEPERADPPEAGQPV